MIFFSEDFGLTDMESGTLFSLTAALTLTYGLLISGYLIDNAGVKPCLLIGSFLLTLCRMSAVFVTSKRDLYLVMTTVAPMGLSLCKLRIKSNLMNRYSNNDIRNKEMHRR